MRGLIFVLLASAVSMGAGACSFPPGPLSTIILNVMYNASAERQDITHMQVEKAEVNKIRVTFSYFNSSSGDLCTNKNELDGIKIDGTFGTAENPQAYALKTISR